MEFNFSTISVYVDENENLIGIPCGESEKYGIADIDLSLIHISPMRKWIFSLKRQNNILLSNIEYTIKAPEAKCFRGFLLCL